MVVEERVKYGEYVFSVFGYGGGRVLAFGVSKDVLGFNRVDDSWKLCSFCVGFVRRRVWFWGEVAVFVGGCRG